MSSIGGGSAIAIKGAFPRTPESMVRVQASSTSVNMSNGVGGSVSGNSSENTFFTSKMNLQGFWIEEYLSGWQTICDESGGGYLNAIFTGEMLTVDNECVIRITLDGVQYDYPFYQNSANSRIIMLCGDGYATVSSSQPKLRNYAAASEVLLPQALMLNGVSQCIRFDSSLKVEVYTLNGLRNFEGRGKSGVIATMDSWGE